MAWLSLRLTRVRMLLAGFKVHRRGIESRRDPQGPSILKVASRQMASKVLEDAQIRAGVMDGQHWGMRGLVTVLLLTGCLASLAPGAVASAPHMHFLADGLMGPVGEGTFVDAFPEGGVAAARVLGVTRDPTDTLIFVSEPGVVAQRGGLRGFAYAGLWINGTESAREMDVAVRVLEIRAGGEVIPIVAATKPLSGAINESMLPPNSAPPSHRNHIVVELGQVVANLDRESRIGLSVQLVPPNGGEVPADAAAVLRYQNASSPSYLSLTWGTESIVPDPEGGWVVQDPVRDAQRLDSGNATDMGPVGGEGGPSSGSRGIPALPVWGILVAAGAGMRVRSRSG